MPAPPAYLDECIDHDLVSSLRTRGFMVTSALEEGQANASVPDEDQLAFATSRGWVLVTHNERHFRALSDAYRRRGETHSGIIVVPASSPAARVALRTAMMLSWLGILADYRGGLHKWGHLQSLLEQGLRFPGYTEDEIRLALAR